MIEFIARMTQAQDLGVIIAALIVMAFAFSVMFLTIIEMVKERIRQQSCAKFVTNRWLEAHKRMRRE